MGKTVIQHPGPGMEPGLGKRKWFLLTELEESDITLDSGTRPGAGRHLHTVADPRGQAGYQRRQGRAVHCAVDVVPALVPQAPNLPSQRRRGNVVRGCVKLAAASLCLYNCLFSAALWVLCYISEVGKCLTASVGFYRQCSTY